MAKKYVFSFGAKKAEGRGDDKELLGGKGAGLMEMTRIGLPVPAGFTITTECCEHFHRSQRKWPQGLEGQVRDGIRRLEKVCRKKLGDARDPLLVSVRSGAAASMPGMMETILNLGLNDDSVEGLARVSGNARFAYDAYRRFIMMYGSTAMGIPREEFDAEFNKLKDGRTRQRLGRFDGNRVNDTDVNEQELRDLCATFKQIYRHRIGSDFPQEPFEQLRGAIDAVFGSWMAEKAVTYRRVEKLTGLRGTAVNVVQMVFGNMGDDSGTGVCFTRDPSTGENVFYGDLLINAQGEDVVAGIRTPIPLSHLHDVMPEVAKQLDAVRVLLELHYHDMQDLEFTVERGTLYMLQCRTGKRSPVAAFRIAVEQATQPLLSRAEAKDLAKRRLLPKKVAEAAVKPCISKADAVRRIRAQDIERLFYPVIDPHIPAAELQKRRLAAGINAVPGAASGVAVFSAADAEARAARGEDVILVRKETSPEDVGGMHVAKGILTATGGKTSHAAVVARGWGKCCIVGCDVLDISYEQRHLSVNGTVVREGEFLTLDGSEGVVYTGRFPLVQPKLSPEYETLMGWCDEIRTLKVRTNADSGPDAERAVQLGAEGIGLCRTEHMFFATEERRLAMQAMIVARDKESRVAALNELLPFQRQDFEEIFAAMNGRPVTIRLIDPPLHEFLPQTDEQVARLSQHTGLSAEQIRHQSVILHEANPMLGHRGCRLCITYPEILEMQVRAIIGAAVNCTQRGIKVLPEIMIPLTIDARELRILTDATRRVAEEVLAASETKIKYLVGTMIETPRAALTAGPVAEVAEFFSFGTNDLTQMTMGLSRDDAGRFLPEYVDASRSAIFPHDPFQTIDAAGVGQLVEMACRNGRKVRRDLKLGICGEHGGDPESVEFCHVVGLDYVSCSPFRVPIARLAAAKAALTHGPGATRAGKGGGKGAGGRRAKRAKRTKAAAGTKASRGGKKAKAKRR